MAVDLASEIAQQQVELLNSHSDAANVLRTGYREDSALTVASECDAELLIHIPFRRIARLTGLRLSSPPGQGPRAVKLFVNQPRLDFEAAAVAVPSYAFELTEKQLSHSDSKDTMITLPVVKFRNVHTISVLVESNQTNDEESTTLLSRIQIFGHAGDSFDVASIKDVSKQDQE